VEDPNSTERRNEPRCLTGYLAELTSTTVRLSYAWCCAASFRVKSTTECNLQVNLFASARLIVRYSVEQVQLSAAG
jgi:hypothetical protein